MRTILHVDLNNFYASVEMLLNPELKDKYVGVSGSVENRHGVILAKSEKAKKLGVKTGMTVNEALKLCPELILVEAKHKHYIEFSEKARKIYRDYTDVIEPFGIDECWLDVTSTAKLFGGGENLANVIRERVKAELELTVSVGVSFNKVFAKLASDLKKPDATTVITQENFKTKVWNLSISDLLFVGKSTAAKLNKINVNTIGDLAKLDKDFLIKKFGKWGGILLDYALGKDNEPVLSENEGEEIKSVSNSVTSFRDLISVDDIKVVLATLTESVSYRLIKYNVGKATTLQVYIRYNDLTSITRQVKLDYPSVLEKDFYDSALQLILKNYDFSLGIRTLGVGVSGFTGEKEELVIHFDNYSKKENFQSVITKIKDKYGNNSFVKGVLLTDKKLHDLGEGIKQDIPKDDNK